MTAKAIATKAAADKMKKRKEDLLAEKLKKDPAQLETTNGEAKKEEEKKPTDGLLKEEKKPATKADSKLTPQQQAAGSLQPGQKYFEAPDGECFIGEADKQQLWHRKLNNGKGGWINPQR